MISDAHPPALVADCQRLAAECQMARNTAHDLDAEHRHLNTALADVEQRFGQEACWAVPEYREMRRSLDALGRRLRVLRAVVEDMEQELRPCPASPTRWH